MSTQKLYEAERAAEKEKKDEYYAKQKELLKKNYGTALSELDANKKKSQEMASITLDKLKKYLPNQLKAQGIAGTGASESTLLQAHSNYMNTMGNIEGNYNTEKATLDTSHNTELAQLAQYQDATHDEIDAKYDAKVESESAANYNQYLDTVYKKLETYVQDDDGDGKLSPDEKTELVNYIKNDLGGLTEQDRNRLLNSLDSYQVRSTDEQTELETTQAKNANKSDVVKIKSNFYEADEFKGDNFEVTIGETPYKVQRGNVIKDSDTISKINSAYGSTPSKGASVVYDGKLYMYLPHFGTDKWCEVEARSNSATQDFNDLCTALGILKY